MRRSPLRLAWPFFPMMMWSWTVMPSGFAVAIDCRRHVDVGARWRRVARGVVVHEDQRRGGELERASDDLARIDRRVVHRTRLLHLVGNELVALVEEDDPELLACLECHRGAAIVDDG